MSQLGEKAHRAEAIGSRMVDSGRFWLCVLVVARDLAILCKREPPEYLQNCFSVIK
jgi:hypothetical protein